MLAGMIQRPNYFNPFRHPERVMERRNLVLDSMVETGAITKEQAERAKAEPLHLSQQSVDASDAPYFVDLVHEQLIQKLGERDFNREGLHIYTSLDPDLQRAATSAVESTIHVVDEQVDKLYARHHKGEGGTSRHLSSGGAGGAESAYRAGTGAGGRAQLWSEPVESCSGEASDGIDIQAICVCDGVQYFNRWDDVAGSRSTVFADHDAQR